MYENPNQVNMERDGYFPFWETRCHGTPDPIGTRKKEFDRTQPQRPATPECKASRRRNAFASSPITALPRKKSMQRTKTRTIGVADILRNVYFICRLEPCSSRNTPGWLYRWFRPSFLALAQRARAESAIFLLAAGESLRLPLGVEPLRLDPPVRARIAASTESRLAVSSARILSVLVIAETL